ncbi:RraA family protein [Candidatus Poribacteria bacterium]|nr:RraA family protein [Candidatus Poribacteria bacterium]
MPREWRNDAELFRIARAELYTAAVGDVLDDLGFRHQFLPSAIRPLDPDSMLVGRAMPVLEADVFAPRDAANPFGRMLEALDDLKPDEVYIAAGASPRYALWGEIMTAAAIARGASGVVCDGYLRDTKGILRQGFPAFSRGSYAQDQKGRGEVIDMRCRIEVGGIGIDPGDILIGDIDGVLVVPREAEDEALTRALAKAGAEKNVLEDVRRGMFASEAFRKYGIL